MSDLDWAIVCDGLRRERDAALAEQRRAVARLAEVSAERDAAWVAVGTLTIERDRLLAAAVAQADAADAIDHPFESGWIDATEATEALGRELRGAR